MRSRFLPDPDRLDVYLVVYDVVSDKRRYLLARQLEDVAVRVQKSVFEARLDPAHAPQLMDELRVSLGTERAGLRVYRLCRRCCEMSEQLGTPLIARPPTAYFL